MNDLPDYRDLQGWERIWASDYTPARFDTDAEPSPQVVGWAGTLPENGYVLDVGCGLGRHMVYLHGLGMRVAGTDISPTAIQRLTAAFAQRGIPTDARVSDMTALPFADATFDAVLSIKTIHHQLKHQIRETLLDFYRVLKPGGTMLVDFNHTGTIIYAEQKRLVAAGQVAEVEPNTFVDQKADDELTDDDWLPHHFASETDVHAFLEGFAEVRVWEVLTEVERSYGTGPVGKWYATAHRPADP